MTTLMMVVMIMIMLTKDVGNDDDDDDEDDVLYFSKLDEQYGIWMVLQHPHITFFADYSRQVPCMHY